MKNELLEIHKRAQEIVCMLSGGMPLSLYDAEMEVVSILTDELLTSMGYEVISYNGSNHPPHKELKRALRNMYFLGKLYGEQKNIVVPSPFSDNNLNIEK